MGAVILHSSEPVPDWELRATPAYFDWAASAPLSRASVEAMVGIMPGWVGNPSSVHIRGRAARMALEDARAVVAGALGARSADIVFTSGGTESDNLAVFGSARAAVRRGRGRHVVVSAIEHAAVLRSAEALALEGFEISRVHPDHRGVLEAEAFRSVLRPDTALVAMMAVNNELGTIQPVAAVAAEARGVGAVFFTDAVQALGHMVVDVREWGVDLLSISAHKVGGPMGMGALYCRPGVEIAPVLHGGWQEDQRRAGTENVLGAVGMGAAIAQAVDDLHARAVACEAVLEKVLTLRSRIVGSRLVGEGAVRVPHIATFLFEDVEAETLLFALDLAGVAASSGAACSSGSLEPSHVLLALGLGKDEARSALRLSWGGTTSAGEVERLLNALPAAVERNRSARRSGPRRGGKGAGSWT